MLRAGLTGGIGTGKSTVAAMMRELGCHILDADRMAHHLIEPGQAAYEGVVKEFGKDILDSEGRVVRPKLGAIVFADAMKLARLNAIVHPHVLAELDMELARLAQTDAHGVGVVEAALLIEAGYHRKLDRLIVVWCTPEQQLDRLVSGRRMTREQAKQRIVSQLNLEEKRKLADDAIDCSGTMEYTQLQVASLVRQLKLAAVATASEL